MPLTDFKIKRAFLSAEFRNPIKQFLFNVELTKATTTPILGTNLDKIPHETYDIINTINAIDKLNGNEKGLFSEYRTALYDEIVRRYEVASDFLEKNKKTKDISLYNLILKHDLNRNKIIHIIAFDDIPQRFKNQYSREKIETLREQLNSVSKENDLLNYISINFDFSLAARCMYAHGYSSQEVHHFSQEIEQAAISCNHDGRGIIDMPWSVITPMWRAMNKFESKEIPKERYTPFFIINEKKTRDFLIPILPWIRTNFSNKKFTRLKDILAEQVEGLLKEEKTSDDFIKFLIEFYKEIRNTQSEKEYLHIGASFFGGVSKRTEFAAVDQLLDVMSKGGKLDLDTKKVLKQGKIGSLLNFLNVNVDSHFESKILPELKLPEYQLYSSLKLNT